MFNQTVHFLFLITSPLPSPSSAAHASLTVNVQRLNHSVSLALAFEHNPLAMTTTQPADGMMSIDALAADDRTAAASLSTLHMPEWLRTLHLTQSTQQQQTFLTALTHVRQAAHRVAAAKLSLCIAMERALRCIIDTTTDRPARFITAIANIAAQAYQDPHTHDQPNDDQQELQTDTCTVTNHTNRDTLQATRLADAWTRIHHLLATEQDCLFWSDTTILPQWDLLRLLNTCLPTIVAAVTAGRLASAYTYFRQLLHQRISVPAIHAQMYADIRLYIDGKPQSQ